MLRTSKLKALIRNGIPNALRGRVWMICSGAYAYMITRRKGYYDSLLAKYSHQESWAKEEIEKVILSIYLSTYPSS